MGMVAVFAASAPSAGPSLADWLTAWGTLGTALFAVAAVVVTIVLAARDRRDARMLRIEDQRNHELELGEERLRSARDLAEEQERSLRDREDAERRLRDERAFAESVRLRERREVAVGALLGRIALLLPHCDQVPGLWRTLAIAQASEQSRFPLRLGSPVGPLLETGSAVESLALGKHSEVWGLADARAARQYADLVHLIQTATGDSIPEDLRKRAGIDLCRYALWVRVSLENLIATGESLDPGIPACPNLRRMPAHDTPWNPSTPSEAWVEAIKQQPGDPFFFPAN
jgi:hypothetical protein